jgi:hypothetical protein
MPVLGYKEITNPDLLEQVGVRRGIVPIGEAHKDPAYLEWDRRTRLFPTRAIGPVDLHKGDVFMVGGRDLVSQEHHNLMNRDGGLVLMVGWRVMRARPQEDGRLDAHKGTLTRGYMAENFDAWDHHHEVSYDQLFGPIAGDELGVYVYSSVRFGWNPPIPDDLPVTVGPNGEMRLVVFRP